MLDGQDVKMKARSLSAKAIKDGVLVRPDSCEQCGRRHAPWIPEEGVTRWGRVPRRIIAHHPDYSLPLSVEWLCDRCHRLRHLVERAAEEAEAVA